MPPAAPPRRRRIDALDEQAIDQHLRSVTDTAGRVDISFNAVGIGSDLRACAAGRAEGRAVLPADRGLHQVVLSDRAPGRKAHDSEPIGGDHDRHRHPFADGHRTGGAGPANAAVEALTRGLSAELAPVGVRVVGLRPQAIPETARIKESFELRAKASGVTWEQVHEVGAGRTHTRRLSTLAELADVAVFVASDQASGMTGTTVNLSMGSLDD